MNEPSLVISGSDCDHAEHAPWWMVNSKIKSTDDLVAFMRTEIIPCGQQPLRSRCPIIPHRGIFLSPLGL